ncbi:MAG: Anaerobic nitric oxide reductase transcription regulator NorR [bacterium]|nr:Anaerobic nitric oxide reductase transcription regulator NorR [bacterium]
MSKLDYTLLQIYRLLLESENIYALLPEILDRMIQDTKAERGQIELYDDNGERRFQKARKDGRDIEDRRESKISSKILASVKETNTAVLSANARKDARFRDSTTVLGQNVLSVACAPLRDEHGTFGVLYIDNRNREALFNEETAKLLNELAGRLAAPLRKKLAEHDERKRMSRELQHLRDRELGYLELIGNSPAMQKMLEKIEFSKDYADNVLILGESGTGKELVARLLHRESKRGEKKFVAFDCSAVPEDILISELFGHERGTFTGAVQRQRGLVEEAEGGTLFLDEIGNLSLGVQAMLLRFLDHKQYRRLGAGEERPADVRLMFATNKDLAELMQRREFRPDLYYRLKRGVVLHVPPLRERREDIPPIADFLLKKFNHERKAKLGFSAEARAALTSYPYPGNVRELEAFVYEAAYAALRTRQETIRLSHLPNELATGSPPPQTASPAANLQIDTNGFYSKYLPKEFQKHHFISGLSAGTDNAGQASNSDHQLHEQLLIAIEPAVGIPLRQAIRAVAHAFERNFMLALFRRTRGNQTAAIKLARLHKSAFIEKKKKHGIHRQGNPFEKGSSET